MLISRSPYRCSIFGGATDIQSFYRDYGGFVINFALKKYCYLSVNQITDLDNINWQAFYSKVEKVENLYQLENGGIRGSLEYLKNKFYPNLNKLSFYVQNEVPDRTGLGTSSAFVTNIIRAVHALNEHNISKQELAKGSIYVERVHNNETGGVQDNIATAFGGLNATTIDKNGEFKVRPIPVSSEFIDEFKSSTLLLYVNQRNSFDIASSIDNKKSDNYKLRLLDLAQEGYNAFCNESMKDIGNLVQKGWEEKRAISTLISNPYIDNLIDNLLRLGCYGVRLMGNGGAGFLLCFFDPSLRKKVIESTRLKYLDVDFDWEGTKIIFQQ